MSIGYLAHQQPFPSKRKDRSCPDKKPISSTSSPTTWDTGDMGCNNSGGKIPTPHLDRLAAQGMRFTDAHASSSVCSPSRYALLTGRYCWRTPLKSSVLWPWDPPLIEADRPHSSQAAAPAGLPHRLHWQVASRLGMGDQGRQTSLWQCSHWPPRPRAAPSPRAQYRLQPTHRRRSPSLRL